MSYKSTTSGAFIFLEERKMKQTNRKEIRDSSTDPPPQKQLASPPYSPAAHQTATSGRPRQPPGALPRGAGGRLRAGKWRRLRLLVLLSGAGVLLLLSLLFLRLRLVVLMVRRLRLWRRRLRRLRRSGRTCCDAVWGEEIKVVVFGGWAPLSEGGRGVVEDGWWTRLDKTG